MQQKKDTILINTKYDDFWKN